MKRWRNRWN